MPYRAPLRDITFCLDHVVGAGRLAETERFAEANAETREAILAEAGKLCETVLAPLNRAGDLQGAVLENGVVRTSPGFAGAYKAIAEGGWVGIAAAEASGGMGLPHTLAVCVNEMMASACLSLSLNPLMTQGQIEALEAHASDEIRALYLPKLTSGEWTGTMNLTEPQAGSDVGALRTKAEPNGDGTYAVTGQKIYISWGDHDMAENICHLVLARLPDGQPGTKGISLFIVPKFLPDGDGKPGVANRVRPISLEHKLGLHGSPTAVMEYDGATGWMIGNPHGGMAAMFTMMNNARLGVGVEGLGVAEAAWQKALEFAQDRRQGKTPVAGTGAIIDHADVRRMLMTMKTMTDAARAICLDTAVSGDLAHAEGGDWGARAAFLTPIAKAFGTDVGCEVAHLGVQVHGGMGYVEETGAAQFSRDVRVTKIYEGTNGIQAMDLVGRKLADGGAAAKALIHEIETGGRALVAAGGDYMALGVGVAIAAETANGATEAMLEMKDMNDRFAGAVPFLRIWALTLGAHYLSRAALAAKDGPEAARRLALAQFFVTQIAPQTATLAAAATAGAAPLYALTPEELAS
jgi:alkylation response protein AidB-like acyl-CoA dehydrogenase